MTAILVILAIVGVSAAIGFYMIKTGKVEDTNGNFVPDVVEEKIEPVKKAFKEIVEEVKKAEPKKRAPRKKKTNAPVNVTVDNNGPADYYSKKK